MNGSPIAAASINSFFLEIDCSRQNGNQWKKWINEAAMAWKGRSIEYIWRLNSIWFVCWLLIQSIQLNFFNWNWIECSSNNKQSNCEFSFSLVSFSLFQQLIRYLLACSLVLLCLFQFSSISGSILIYFQQLIKIRRLNFNKQSAN